MNAEEVYALLNKKIKKGGITDDQIRQIVEQHFEKNPVQVITDNTLSVAGTPADALATGTAIDSLKGDLGDIQKSIGDFETRTECKNLVKWKNVINGKYYDGNVGDKITEVNNKNYTISGAIVTKSFQNVYVISSGYSFIFFTDETGVILSKIELSSRVQTEVNIPSESVYMYLFWSNSEWADIKGNVRITLEETDDNLQIDDSCLVLIDNLSLEPQKNDIRKIVLETESEKELKTQGIYALVDMGTKNIGVMKKNGIPTTDSNDGTYYSLKVNAGDEFFGKLTYGYDYRPYVLTDREGNVIRYADCDLTKTGYLYSQHFTIEEDGILYVNNVYTLNALLYKKVGSKPINERLDGKTVLFFGDSICFGANDDDNNKKVTRGGAWCSRIALSNPNSLCVNYGQSGSTIALRSSYSNSVLEELAIAKEKYPSADYIIIEGGVNDAYNPSVISLGTITIGYNDTYDNNTFCGALESCFKYAQENYPNAKIGFICSHKVPSAMQGEYDFNTIIEKAKKICEKWSIPYLDLFNQSGFNYFLDSHVTEFSAGDGLHPNGKGYDIISPKIDEWLKTL